MEEKLTKQEMIAKLQEIKSRAMDPYGLTKFDKKSETMVSQVTEFDSFLLFDSIQLLNVTTKQMMEFKTNPETLAKTDQETKLYKVTIGDGGTEYYNYATMYNRLTNEVYASKVAVSVNQLRQFMSSNNKIIDRKIEDAVRSVDTPEFDATLNRIGR